MSRRHCRLLRGRSALARVSERATATRPDHVAVYLAQRMQRYNITPFADLADLSPHQMQQLFAGD